MLDDGRFLCIGGCFYTRTEDHAFQKFDHSIRDREHIEELGSGQGMVALAFRRKLPATSLREADRAKGPTTLSRNSRSSNSSVSSEADDEESTGGSDDDGETSCEGNNSSKVEEGTLLARTKQTVTMAEKWVNSTGHRGKYEQGQLASPIQ
jgi:hypothetical protein